MSIDSPFIDVNVVASRFHRSCTVHCTCTLRVVGHAGVAAVGVGLGHVLYGLDGSGRVGGLPVRVGVAA